MWELFKQFSHTVWGNLLFPRILISILKARILVRNTFTCWRGLGALWAPSPLQQDHHRCISSVLAHNNEAVLTPWTPRIVIAKDWGGPKGPLSPLQWRFYTLFRFISNIFTWIPIGIPEISDYQAYNIISSKYSLSLIYHYGWLDANEHLGRIYCVLFW